MDNAIKDNAIKDNAIKDGMAAVPTSRLIDALPKITGVDRCINMPWLPPAGRSSPTRTIVDRLRRRESR